jgi:hypothetical protein
MIVGYRNKQTAQFAVGRKVKAFTGFEQAARLKLDRLDAAIALADLAALPGNRFQTLKDERKEDVLGRRSNRAGSVPSGLAGCQLDWDGLHGTDAQCGSARCNSTGTVSSRANQGADWVVQENLCN